MEPTIWIGEEGNMQGNEACEPFSHLASPKQDADPVVYKLVRVDFDGRFVPATDKELMEVEDFFDYENSQFLSVADVLQTDGFGFSEDDLPDNRVSAGDEAFLQYVNPECGEEQLDVTAKCNDDTMQRAPEEEMHEAASVLPVHPSANGDIVKPVYDQHENFYTADNKDHIEMPTVGILSTLHDSGTNQSSGPGESSNTEDEVMEKEISASNASSSLKPDFSLTRGEINLHEFKITELQEFFRATFGRETTVKDKRWLKRRIAMGLVNSCDIPTSNYIIEDNKLVKNCEGKNCEKVDVALVTVTDMEISGEDVKDAQVDFDNMTEDAKSTGSSSLLAEINTDDNNPSDQSLLAENNTDDNSPSDQRAAKRVRKPTKRYIEELSNVEIQETVEMVMKPSDKIAGEMNDFSNSAVRPSLEIRSSADYKKPDTLWGCGFQVPRVSRIRRCRPRKGNLTLTPGRLEDEPVRDAARVSDSQLPNIGGQKVSEAKDVPFTELCSDEEKTEKLGSEVDIAMLAEEQESKYAYSSGYNQNSGFTANGGTRRKHHRAWGLSEVVKLVDGVSKYGAGRWSEIKRVSFTPYPHRTSVDLKDKWRNLLKASFAVIPSDNRINPQQQRKPMPMPLPTPILLKVRELAELHGQVPRNFKARSGNRGG